jgi:hypothetical protein
VAEPDIPGALFSAGCLFHAHHVHAALNATLVCIICRVPPYPAVTFDDNEEQRQMHLYQEEYKFMHEETAGVCSAGCTHRTPQTATSPFDPRVACATQLPPLQLQLLLLLSQQPCA